MKKSVWRTGLFAVLAIFILLCASVWASDVAYSLQDGTLTVSGTGAMSNYTPQSAPWYAQREAITSVVVEDGVSVIGDYAFADCVNLQSVTIADSVTTIGDYAFSGCTAMQTLPFANTIRFIGADAFSGCASLREIIVPSSVEFIAEEAFYGCSNAKLLWLGSSLKGIGANAFSACDSLEEIRVNSSNTVFSASGSFLLSNDQTVLHLCAGGTSGTVTVPTSVKTIAPSAFAHCHKMTGVALSKTENIGTMAFADCTALTSVTLPDTVTEIGANAFLRCQSLAKVVIGSGLKTLGNNAFEGCNALSSIVSTSSSFPVENNVIFNSTKKQILFCPKTISGSYKVPKGVTRINDGAFADCTELTEIVLPEGLIRIQDYCFFGCTKLASISIPAAVEYIGSGAFANCDSLTEITVDSGNTFYASSQNVLYGLKDNTVWCVPAGISGTVSITGRAKTDACAFWGCAKMTALDIDATLTTLGNGAYDDVFYGCTALQKINVASGNATYASDDNGILYNKDKTRILYCPQAIDGECEIPSTVQSVGDRVFAGRINLSVVRFAQDGVTASVGERAFANCTALESVKLGEAVNAVGSGVFSGCTHLQVVFFNGGLPTESSNPFYDIGADVMVVSLGDDADTWNGITAKPYQKVVAYYDANGKMVAVQFITEIDQSETHEKQSGETRKVIYLLPDHSPIVP